MSDRTGSGGTARAAGAVELMIDSLVKPHPFSRKSRSRIIDARILSILKMTFAIVTRPWNAIASVAAPAIVRTLRLVQKPVELVTAQRFRP